MSSQCCRSGLGPLRPNRAASRRARRARRATLWAAVLGGAVPLPALAVNRTYPGPTGLWINGANWTPAGIPGPGDTVFVAGTVNPGVSVIYDGSIPATNTTFL